MKENCTRFCCVSCVDGSCPKTNEDSWIHDCRDCYHNQGCIGCDFGVDMGDGRVLCGLPT